jgi:hypothetical protein
MSEAHQQFHDLLTLKLFHIVPVSEDANSRTENLSVSLMTKDFLSCNITIKKLLYENYTIKIIFLGQPD